MLKWAGGTPGGQVHMCASKVECGSSPRFPRSSHGGRPSPFLCRKSCHMYPLYPVTYLLVPPGPAPATLSLLFLLSLPFFLAVMPPQPWACYQSTDNTADHSSPTINRFFVLCLVIDELRVASSPVYHLPGFCPAARVEHLPQGCQSSPPPPPKFSAELRAVLGLLSGSIDLIQSTDEHLLSSLLLYRLPFFFQENRFLKRKQPR